MRTRTETHGHQTKRQPRGRGKTYHTNKGKCLHPKAIASFCKMKNWVKLNEPELYEAFE